MTVCRIQKMIRDVDPGLDRRFPPNNRILFEDYSRDELGLILDQKLLAARPPLSMSVEVCCIRDISYLACQANAMSCCCCC